MRKKLAFALSAFMLAAPVVQAQPPPIVSGQDTAGSNFIENRRDYGNCSVADVVDMFTDEVSHSLQCRQPNGETRISFYVVAMDDETNPMMFVKTGLQSRSGEIAIRVDSGEVITGEWVVMGGYASCAPIADPKTGCNLGNFQRLLIEVATGERIAIKVGGESGSFLLEGSHEAVADFLERTQDKIPTVVLPIED